MKHNKTGISRVATVIVIFVLIVVIATAAFLVLTYPRDEVNFQVSFTVGATKEQKVFAVPILDSSVQVGVIIQSGGALWTATIFNEAGSVLWTHSAIQGQTTYTSQWTVLNSGNYNFSFATAGAGSLNAQIIVKAKGGFW